MLRIFDVVGHLQGTRKKKKWVKSSGKHKNEKKKAENRGAIPLKKKGGRRSTAADDLSLSSM